MMDVLRGFAVFGLMLINPTEMDGDTILIATQQLAVLARLARWLEANAVSELLIDGPFITGEQFALFIDMEITRRATGKRNSFSEIATYTVRAGQIIEGKFFYG